MENAAKALLIAGGIFFAILILSLIVYMSTATSRMIEAQEQKKMVEELETFNKSYQAYNKTRMYGADVITVVKKAIDYNRGLDASQANKAITIEVEIIDTFETTEQIVETSYKDGTTTKGDLKTIESESLKVKNGGSENIKIDYNTNYNSNVVKFFELPTEHYKEELSSSSSVYKVKITYTALANFKRAIFTCTNCEDTDNDGRIDYMRFKQYMTLEVMDTK